MKNGVYFIVIALLVAELFTDFDLCKLDDLWRHSVDTKWCKITKYGISVQILSLQGWNFAGLMCCKNYFILIVGYDVTIATYSLPDLYLPKMKTALFVAPEFNRLSCACAV